MADEIDINIGTFNLDSTSSVAIADINISVAKSIQEFDLPKFHGSVIPIGKRKNLNVRITGTITGSNYDNLRANLDGLKAAFEALSEQNLTLDDDRILKVQYRNFSYSYKTLRTFSDFSVDLVASDPFWYAVALTTNDQNPVTVGVPYIVNNPGNAPARVKVQVSHATATITDDCRIENQTTGETMQYRGTIYATQNLIVNNRMDAVDLAVTNNGIDDIKKFEGDFITLNPGDNNLMFVGTNGARVQIIFRAAYY